MFNSTVTFSNPVKMKMTPVQYYVVSRDWTLSSCLVLKMQKLPNFCRGGGILGEIVKIKDNCTTSLSKKNLGCSKQMMPSVVVESSTKYMLDHMFIRCIFMLI